MPAVPYTSADLDWTNRASRSSVEMKNLAIRPQLADTDAKIEQYDRILLGYPIWLAYHKLIQCTQIA